MDGSSLYPLRMSWGKDWGSTSSPNAGLHGPLQTPAEREKKPVGGGERSWMLCGMSLWAWLDSGSPGLLVGAQAAHCAVPGTTAYTGIRGWEATYSTERALGSGWGTGTGCQVVGTLRRTQVLQRHEGTGILSSPICHAAGVHQES